MTQHDTRTISELAGNWKTTTDKVTAIKDIENKKNVKYGENILDEYDETMELNHISGFTPSSIEEKPRDMHRVILSGKYFRRAEKIRKMTESDYMHVFSGENLPIIVVYYADVEDGRDYRGAFLVAPRIKEED